MRFSQVTSTDRHTSTESHAQTPYTWEDGTPVHLSRLRKDTPVKMKNPNDQNGEGHTGQGGAKSRSLPGQKGPPPTAARGGQKRKLHQAGRTMRQCKKCDLGVNGGGGRKGAMSDFVCIRGGAASLHGEYRSSYSQWQRRQGSQFHSLQPRDVVRCIELQKCHVIVWCSPAQFPVREDALSHVLLQNRFR